MPLAAAVVSTAYSAYSSNKAAKEQAAGIQKGIDASASIAQQARDDVMKIWDYGASQGRAGLNSAFNFYKQAAPQRMDPVTQGFQQGINVLGQGAQQANNAILGLPVDMSFTNQQVQQAPAGYLDAAVLPQAPMQDVTTLLGEQPVAQPVAQQNPTITQLPGGKWNLLLGRPIGNLAADSEPSIAADSEPSIAAEQGQKGRPYTTAVMGR